MPTDPARCSPRLPVVEGAARSSSNANLHSEIPQPLVELCYGPASSGSHETAYRPCEGSASRVLRAFPTGNESKTPSLVRRSVGEGRR